MDESIVKHLEQPQVGTLKLSEAIRIGAKIRPQCFGVAFENGGSCALGAAFEGSRGYPWPESDPMGFPMTPLYTGFGVPWEVVSEAFKRNDSRQSRESIADWLESRGY